MSKKKFIEEIEILNKAIVDSTFSLGDLVTGVVWEGYEWRIESMYFSRGRLRARLESTNKNLAYCSEFIEKLKKQINH